MYGEIQKFLRVLVGNPEGKRLLGRPRRGWEDIKMDLREVDCDAGNQKDLARDRDKWRAYARAVIILRVPYGSETSSLTLREEQRLSVFENKVEYLEKYLGLRDEIAGE